MRSCGCGNCIYDDTPYVPPQLTKEQEVENLRLAREREILRIKRQERFLSEILPNAVVPIIGQSDGCGFFIENHFITAGHCLDNGPISICVDCNTYTFNKEDAIVLQTIDPSSEKPQTGDIAVFEFNNYKHCLKLGDEISMLETFDDFFLPHYIHSSIKDNNNSIFTSSKESYKLNIDKFTLACPILEKVGTNSYVSHFFEANTEAQIKEGSSGSPLLNGKNEVVGLLIGCLQPNDKPNTILFQQLGNLNYQINMASRDW